jgi:8-oxo-dGTP pyrophosphatase MutT (NUDIX family)
MSKHRYAAGLVVYRVDSTGKRLYLLIQHSAGYWELPKGHIEPGESWRQTALRELLEETGIDDARLIPGFARQIEYLYRDGKQRLIYKTVHFGLACTKSETVRLSDEHFAFAFLDYPGALRRLTHAGTRAVLRDAEAFVLQAGI